MEQLVRDAWEQELNILARNNTCRTMPSRHMLNVVRATSLIFCDERSIAMDAELERLSDVVSLLPNHIVPTIDPRTCVSVMRSCN